MKKYLKIALISLSLTVSACSNDGSTSLINSNNSLSSVSSIKDTSFASIESNKSSLSSNIVSSSIISSEQISSSSFISSSISSQKPISSSSNVSSVASSSSTSSSAISSSSSTPSSSPVISSSSSSSSSTPAVDVTTYYDNYYASLTSWTNGEDLKNQLYTIMRNGYKPLTYTGSSQNYISNIHADHTYDDFEYLDVVYSDARINSVDTQKGWQREHAFCASLMCGSTTGNAIKQKGRATDFHNLFAAQQGGNSSRGNKNYGVADTNDEYYQNRTVNNGEDGYSFDETTFEPANHDKGRLARAIFYMATMYKEDEVDNANNILMKGLTIKEEPISYIAGNDCEFAIGHLSELLSWNNYAVDNLEMQHNIAVYSDKNNIDGYAQGNRNPYVDYPELVEYAFGDKKDQGGKLSDLIPSAYYLESEKDEISHYAIKTAKREYSFNEKIKEEDYQIVAVNKNFTYSEVNDNITHSLSDHTFNESDGATIGATIYTPINQINYQITLDPMATCSTGILSLDKTGINTSAPNTEQNVTYGGVPFLLSFTGDGSSISCTNIGAGGVTLGSGTSGKQLLSLTIKTKNSYALDRLYIKTMVSNKASNYSLTIKVGEETVFTGTVNDNVNWKIFGGKVNEGTVGQISFIFKGSTGLKINSIAFNDINA